MLYATNESVTLHQELMIKGIERYKLPVIEWVSHGNEQCSIRNIVNNTVTTLYDDHTYCGDGPAMYRIDKSRLYIWN